MHGHEICASVEVIERDQFRIQRHRLRGHKRVVGNHLHRKSRATVRDDPADIAKPDHAQGLARNFNPGELRALPFATYQRRIGLRDMPRQRKQQGDGMLGRRGIVPARAIHHHNAATRGCRHIHIVDTDPGATNHLEPRARIDHLGGDARPAANHQPVIVGDDLEQLLGRQTGPIVQFQILPGCQDFKPLRSQLVRNENAI